MIIPACATGHGTNHRRDGQNRENGKEKENKNKNRPISISQMLRYPGRSINN